MFNKVILIGNLTRDPEMKFTPAGKAVCTLGIAVNTGYGDQKETLFINVVAWGKQAEACEKYLAKGKQVLVEGSLREQKWEKDGKKHSKFEINASAVQFMGGKGEGEGEKPATQPDDPANWPGDVEAF